jgi:ArsR family transcriptional regulator
MRENIVRIRKNEEQLSGSDESRIAAASDALAHPARIRMYRYILKNNLQNIPVRNKDIVAEFSYSQATVSQHLNKLLIGGLIEAQSKGTSTYYYAHIGGVTEYIEALRKI